MLVSTREFDTAIIGCGPGGLGPIVAADKDGRLGEWLEKGVAFIDKSPAMGPGNLGYKINSNSGAADFLVGFKDSKGLLVNKVLSSEAALDVAAYGRENIPLELVANLQTEIGKSLMNVLNNFPQSKFYGQFLADELRSDGEAGWSIGDRLHQRRVVAKNVILATGAEEHFVNELVDITDRKILSLDVLSGKADARIDDCLREVPDGEIIVLGGSHSAFSVVNLLSKKYPERKITVLHRDDVKVFFESVGEAHQSDYNFNPEEDVCPKTGRVYRFAGLRGDAKKLFLNIVNEGDSRVGLKKFSGGFEEVRAELEGAAVVVQAFGQKAKRIEVLSQGGDSIGPAYNAQGHVKVDFDSRVIGRNGDVVKNVYAIGLGHGVRPSPEIGGERSFGGDLDAVNLYQTLVGKKIFEQIIKI